MVKLSDGCLYYNRDESPQLVLYSQVERTRVLKECHNDAGGAHQGIVRTQNKIKTLYYWMSITCDVEVWVKYMFIICFLRRLLVYFPNNIKKINI